jgi:hypothetical protein
MMEYDRISVRKNIIIQSDITVTATGEKTFSCREDPCSHQMVMIL